MFTKYPTGVKLLIFSCLFSIIHHIDHILRIDHSGWPFIPAISPFTYSLLVYPVFIFVFLAHRKSWYRVICIATLFAFATSAHIFFEPLRDKFHTWTYGSNLPGHVNEENMLGVNSPVIGIISICIAVSLSLMLLLTLIFFIKEAKLYKTTSLK